MMKRVNPRVYAKRTPEGMTRMKKERITGARMAMFSISRCKVKTIVPENRESKRELINRQMLARSSTLYGSHDPDKVGGH